MTTTYPTEIQQFIAQELASGDFKSESDLLIQAMKVFRELKTRHESLRRDVQAAVVSAEQGAVAPLDIYAIKAELTDELNEAGHRK